MFDDMNEIDKQYMMNMQAEINRLHDSISSMEYKIDQFSYLNQSLEMKIDSLDMSLSHISAMFVESLIYETFKNMIVNSNIFPDVNKSSILYYVGEILNILRSAKYSHSRACNDFIMDWTVELYGEITIEESLIEIIKAVYQYCIGNNLYSEGRRNDNVRTILDENIDIETLYNNIDEQYMSYILRNISVESITQLIDMSLSNGDSCKFNSICNYVSRDIQTNNDTGRYSNVFSSVYDIIVNNNHSMYESVMEPNTLKTIKAIDRRIDNYFKLLNKEK